MNKLVLLSENYAIDKIISPRMFKNILYVHITFNMCEQDYILVNQAGL